MADGARSEENPAAPEWPEVLAAIRAAWPGADNAEIARKLEDLLGFAAASTWNPAYCPVCRDCCGLTCGHLRFVRFSAGGAMGLAPRHGRDLLAALAGREGKGADGDAGDADVGG